MAELFDSISHLAQQHIDQVPYAKALPGAIDAGQRHLRGLRGIPGGYGVQAVVALLAIAGMIFAKITQQRLVTAGGGFTEA